MCPFCRETIPEVHLSRQASGVLAGGRAEIRRGLLYMLLAGVLYYFAAGYSPWELPLRISSALTNYLLPFLFLAGLGYFLLGIYRRTTG